MGRLITVGIFLIGAVLIFVFPIRGIFDSLEPSRMQIADLNEALFNAGQIQLRRDTLQEQYNNFKSEDLAKLDKLLPSHVDSVRLIIDINNIARENGLIIEDITIGENDPESNGEEAISLPTSGNLFDTLRLSIVAQGRYDSFKAFLKDVERSLRIVDLVDLSFTSDVKDELLPPDTYTYNTVIETYWLKAVAE